MTSLRTRQIRVGLFFALAVTLLVSLILLLGKSQSLFSRKVSLQTSFANTSGLVVGAPVRLAGVDVGIVQAIRFDPDLQVRAVHVTLAVESRYLERIRSDSVARLSSKGLLGDMIVDITVGSPEATPLKKGEPLASRESQGFAELAESAKQTIESVRDLSTDVDRRLKGVLTEDLGRDLGRIAHATADVAENVQHGRGVVHALVYDPRSNAQLQALLADSDKTVRRVDSMVGDAQRSAASIAAITGEIEHGGGALHSLVYDRDQRNLFANLTAFSEVLKRAGEDIDQGKGTLGALLKDPSVYEDLKVILGNVKRSFILRALVRYTIRKDGLRAPEHPSEDPRAQP